MPGSDTFKSFSYDETSGGVSIKSSACPLGTSPPEDLYIENNIPSAVFSMLSNSSTLRFCP